MTWEEFALKQANGVPLQDLLEEYTYEAQSSAWDAGYALGCQHAAEDEEYTYEAQSSAWDAGYALGYQHAVEEDEAYFARERP